MDKALQNYLQQTFQLPALLNELEDAEKFLAEKINQLIQNDFNQLVQILYRIDVNEGRLKQLLKNNPDEDAGKIIASLIIERQMQKIKSRQHFKQKKDDNSKEEKW